jgi:hypothetical protein
LVLKDLIPMGLINCVRFHRTGLLIFVLSADDAFLFLSCLGINYCNEKLQQVFCKSTFEKELALYAKEGVMELPDIVIPDNSLVLEHIDGLFNNLQDLIKAK